MAIRRHVYFLHEESHLVEGLQHPEHVLNTYVYRCDKRKLLVRYIVIGMGVYKNANRMLHLGNVETSFWCCYIVWMKLGP